MEEEQYFIYINLDGFGKYYYDIANKAPFSGTPCINRLIKEGVYFNEAYTGIPSITYPMQSSILSGAYSNVTKNVYKYYDRELNKIILCRHQNKGETIGEIIKKENEPFISIQQFGLHEKGAEYDDERFLYIQPGGDYKVRFDELFKILRGQKVLSKEKYIGFNEIPHFIFVYIDDLDSIGHNPPFARGKQKAITEKGRIKNVVTRLIDIDGQLGLLIEELERLNIYHNTTILLTSDHGMVPFKGKSSLYKLIGAFKTAGFNNIEVLKNEGDSVKHLDKTELVITGAGLELQVYFKQKISDDKLIEIKRALLKKEYIEYCLTRQELKEKGIDDIVGDLVISPQPPFHFNMDESTCFVLGGGHDSLNENAQHIFAVIKGKAFKREYTYDKKVQNIDFIPTISSALNIPMSKYYKGRILEDTFFTDIIK